MATTLVLEEDIEIPMGIQNLADFRRWAISEAFPERGRFDYINGRIEVDLSLRDLFFHGLVKTELIRVLGNRIHDHDLGQVFASRVRYSNPAANLSVQPDVMFYSYETMTSQHAKLVPDPSGKPHRYVEIEGAIDLIIQ